MKHAQRLTYFLLYCLVLLAAFWRLVEEWIRRALEDGLSSYVLIIPVISGTLLLWQRRTLRPGPSPALIVTVFLILGIAGVLGSLTPDLTGVRLDLIRGLPGLTFALVSCFIAGFAGFLGADSFYAARFPLLFLYVMVPLPEWVASPLTALLQYGSAALSYVLLKLTIFPLYWDNATVFTLPGITIHVAEECSGIHSTLILLISALLISHLLLRTTKAKILLILLAFPIGILRNAVRIWILALLTVYVDPQALSGSLHRQGGPIFFVGSMILLVFAAWRLRGVEDRAARKKGRP